MAIRRRSAADGASADTTVAASETTTFPTATLPFAPDDGLSSHLLLPFYLLFFHYPIDAELRRSILINSAMSFSWFMAALRIIPVAFLYVLRRNFFGYDINKKGNKEDGIRVFV